jgi:hypothetical protein
LKKWNKKFAGFNQNPKQCRERWRNHLDPRVNKNPWQPEEELVFIDKHKVYGNKWAEIGKFLNGRNDNAVKNYYYSTVRKVMRKISLKKLTYDLKDNDVERELTIYLSQYIMVMYQEYINKKKIEKGMEVSDSDMQVLSDSNEESKQERSNNLRTGDKYIIRKLVSLKITPAQIQDYINLVISGKTSNTTGGDYGMHPVYQNNFTNMNYMDFNQNPYTQVNQNPYMQVPQVPNHQRSNSWYANDRPMNIPQVHNGHMMDDFQLINGFSQINLNNQRPNYGQNNLDFYQFPEQNNNSNDLSLENNFSNYEGHLSSIPAHMIKKTNRSHSIKNIPECSLYMKDSFLFDKMGDNSAAKDDTVIKFDLHPLNLEPKPLHPTILNKKEADLLSSSSKSSQSSFVSINDGASCSSLEMSFDGSGLPYLKPFSRQSAFAKVKKNNASDLSQSQDSEEHSNRETEKHMIFDDLIFDENKNQYKSSFFKLKVKKDNEG